MNYHEPRCTDYELSGIGSRAAGSFCLTIMHSDRKRSNIEAMNELAKSLRSVILSTPTGQGIIIK